MPFQHAFPVMHVTATDQTVITGRTVRFIRRNLLAHGTNWPGHAKTRDKHFSVEMLLLLTKQARSSID